MRLREFDEKEQLLTANEKLTKYKTAAGADAAAADASGNFARGHKRFKGINAATKKQFDNDAKLSQLKEFAEQGVAEDATDSFDYDQLSAMSMKDRLALFKTNPELKNLYNTEFQRRIDATLNNYAWMTPQEQAQYKQLAAKDQAATQATGTRTTYGAERYLKQLFQQKMDAKKAAAMLKVHWAPLNQLESFLQGKVNNKIELSAYLVPNAESLGKTRWGGGSNPTVGIVLDGHITIGGRGDLGSDIIDAVPVQRRQQKYASRPGQIDPTLSMDTSVHHEILIDNWKIKGIVLPADIPPEVDRLVQQYKIPVRRLGNPQGVAEGWSQKYKRSINCSHPKGFSQKAHCAGKQKHNESIEMEMVCEDCGMCQSHGSLNEIAKGAKDANSVTKCWPGKHAEGTKTGKNGGQVRNCVPNESVAEEAKHGLYYNVNKRKAAGTSRPASSPKAPTAQAWKDAAKTAKNENVAEDSLAAMRRLAGVTTPAPAAAPNGPRQYRHMPTAVQPR